MSTGPRSTTALYLNGDEKLNPLEKARYYLHHFLRNRREDGPPLDREVYWPSSRADYEAAIDRLVFHRTPARLLCNAFWQLVDWPLLRRELGELSLHDMGCGSGMYGQWIREAAGFPVTYWGFDIKPYASWDTYRDPGTQFAVYDGRDTASTFAHRPNLFITQSALEHIPGDLDYFEAVNGYLQTVDRALQIHMVPAGSGLWQWGPHGWRQYNRTQLRRIEATLRPGQSMTVVCLGGPPLVALHRKWAGRSRDIRRLKRSTDLQARYRQAWTEALEGSQPCGVDAAAFLAIVIQQGLDLPIWPRLMKTRPSG